MGKAFKNKRFILIQIILLAVIAFSHACSSDYQGIGNGDEASFADIPVVPYVPDLAINVITTTNNRQMHLSPVPGSPPELHLGTGLALVKVKNNTQQITSGTLNLEMASDNFSLLVMEFCPSDASKNCIDVSGLSSSFDLMPGQEIYFTIHLEASGSIGFAPVANAVKLNFQGTGDDASVSLTINIPVVNEN